MDAAVVVDVGVEGGGVTIYGRKADGVWSFWQDGSAMYLDENDDEGLAGVVTNPTQDLLSVLPDQWWRMYPIAVHPEFVSQLRAEYERRAAEAGHDRRFSHGCWMEAFGGANPGGASGAAPDPAGV